MTMRIEDKTGNEITNLEVWKELFNTPQQKKHWKPGRSAHSIADFIIHHNGGEKISALIAKVLNESVILEKAIPEYEVPFDKYGRGRVHDLGVFGKTQSGKSLFVGVESKVDESFNKSVLDIYIESKAKQLSGISTNAPERIEGLLKLNFKKINPSVFNVRYQLLYSTAGTVAENADVSVLLIIVFKTALYDESKGLVNYRDYLKFIDMVESVKIPIEDSEAIAHSLSIGDKKLISVYWYLSAEDS